MPIIDNLRDSKILDDGESWPMDGVFPQWNPVGYVYINGVDDNESSMIEVSGATRPNSPQKIKVGPIGSQRVELNVRGTDTIKCRRGKIQVLAYTW